MMNIITGNMKRSFFFYGKIIVLDIHKNLWQFLFGGVEFGRWLWKGRSIDYSWNIKTQKLHKKKNNTQKKKITINSECEMHYLWENKYVGCSRFFDNLLRNRFSEWRYNKCDFCWLACASQQSGGFYKVFHKRSIIRTSFLWVVFVYYIVPHILDFDEQNEP